MAFGARVTAISVRFFTVLFLLAATVAGATLAPAIPRESEAHPEARVAREKSGIGAFELGVMDGSPGELRALGARWTRAGAHWGTVQPTPEVYDWAAVDARILPLSNRGINVIFGIRAISPWGSYCSQTLSGVRLERLAEFKAFVQAAVERYDGDGIDDAPGLGPTPVNVWQVENQWVTATFFRDSSNCNPPARLRSPEMTGDPALAAAEFVAEYQAVVEAVRSADADALIGPGNIPTQSADAAVFCEGRSGPTYTQNFLRRDGTVAKTIHFTHRQVCDSAGANPYNIKRWIRYWSVVLNDVMPRIQADVDFVDAAQYGRYQDVERRNEWLKQRIEAWGFERSPAIVAWEAGGPDWRNLLPSPDWRQSSGYDLPKRLAVAFATGTASFSWFHYRFEPRASVALRHTSLLDEQGETSFAYWNFRLFARAMIGAEKVTFDRLRSTTPGRGVYLVRFRRSDGHQIAIAWADAGADVAIPVDHAVVTLIPFAGSERPPRTIAHASHTGEGGRRARVVRLHLDAQPLMIRD